MSFWQQYELHEEKKCPGFWGLFSDGYKDSAFASLDSLQLDWWTVFLINQTKQLIFGNRSKTLLTPIYVPLPKVFERRGKTVTHCLGEYHDACAFRYHAGSKTSSSPTLACITHYHVIVMYPCPAVCPSFPFCYAVPGHPIPYSSYFTTPSLFFPFSPHPTPRLRILNNLLSPDF